jgi:MFS family permease
LRSVSSPAPVLAALARSGTDYYAFVAANRPLIGFGIVTAFATSFGQTFFISLFVPAFLGSFGLGEAGFGYLYAVATLASALLLPAVGALIDRADLRRYTTVTTLGLAAAALTVALAPNYLVLAVGLAGLRFTGQGLLGHISYTVMAKSFERSRGKALGMASIGYPMGEAILPITFALLLGVTDWRSAWGVVALASLGLIVPLRRLVQAPREAAEAEVLNRKPHGRGTAGSSKAFHDPHFYLMLLPVLLTPFILTGMFLYQIPFANARGWPPELIAGAITVFAVVRAACSIAVGPLIDRWTARRLTPLFLLPLAAGLATLTLSREAWVPFAYLGLAGVTGGISGSITSAVWAEMFGVENIGRIRGVTSGLAILSTAASPVLVGTLLTRGVNYEAIITSACLLLLMGCLVALPVSDCAIRTRAAAVARHAVRHIPVFGKAGE